MAAHELPPFSQKGSLDQWVVYGQALIDLRRYADAEQHFSRAAAYHPQEWQVRYYLGLALLNQAREKPEKASQGFEQARKALGLQPAEAACHFLLALAYLVSRKYALALETAHAGIRLDPQDPWGYALAAQIFLVKRNWHKALQAAETGLALEAEDTGLLNSRAEALTMLGRKDEALAALQSALERDPSSPRSHANRGWLALHNNQPVEALRHFRTALRADPTSEGARAGLLASLQARSPLYRLVLRYYLWAGSLTQGEFWAALVMINTFNSLLRTAAHAFPPLWILVFPYLLLFSLFSFFTWIADSFYNLLMRLSPTGRLVLSKDETASARGCGFLGALVLINGGAFAAILLIDAGALNRLWFFAVGAAVSGAMILPVAGIFKVHPVRRTQRTILVVIAALLGSCSVCGWVGSYSPTLWHLIPLGLFVLGWMIYPWIATVIITTSD